MYDENDFEDKPINILDLYTQNLVKRDVNCGLEVVTNKSTEMYSP